jgi:LacI family transcriptional regulator
MPAPRKVALLIESSNAYGRGLLRGIEAYVREHGRWSIYLAEQGRGEVPPAWLATWKGHGVIARIENPAIAAALAPLKIPVVDVSAARLLPKLPWFETDDVEFASLAATHLLERGLTNFAFCGDARFNWSTWREEHFTRLIREAGHECHHFRPSRRAQGSGEHIIDEIGRWLAALPKPLGVFACYDVRGHQILDACRRRGIAVPDEVAVLGSDNDDLLCDLADPPLSSVIPNTRRTGHEAAALLDRLMAGEKAQARVQLIPPTGIATRQSTEVLAVADRHIAHAVRLIRDRACKGLRVEEIARAAGISRRLLESRFKKLLGKSPHAEIVRMQLSRVKELLAETDLTLREIADRTGFQHVEYLSTVFKKKLGIPPSRYRAEHQPHLRR